MMVNVRVVIRLHSKIKDGVDGTDAGSTGGAQDAFRRGGLKGVVPVAARVPHRGAPTNRREISVLDAVTTHWVVLGDRRRGARRGFGDDVSPFRAAPEEPHGRGGVELVVYVPAAHVVLHGGRRAQGGVGHHRGARGQLRGRLVGAELGGHLRHVRHNKRWRLVHMEVRLLRGWGWRGRGHAEM